MLAFFTAIRLFLQSLSPKTIIITVATAIVLGFGFHIYHTISSLKSQHEKDVAQITSLNQDITTLKNNIETINKVNSQNQQTIDDLKKERQDAIEQADFLAKQNKETTKKFDSLSKQIAAYKNTKNDGPVSKVLKDTIDGIQAGKK